MQSPQLTQHHSFIGLPVTSRSRAARLLGTRNPPQRRQDSPGGAHAWLRSSLSRFGARRDASVMTRERSQGPESWRAGPWRRSDLTEVLLRRLLGLRETFRTVRVSQKAIVRIHAMCVSILSRRDPARTIKGDPSLVSKESAETTDGEQRGLSLRSGRRLMSDLSEQGFHGHTPPLSFLVQSPPDREEPVPYDEAYGRAVHRVWH
jgi:hypothetical protein